MHADDESRSLSVDRLPGSVDAVQVLWLTGEDVGGSRARAPHRHAYHELVWVRSGRGEHLVDGLEVPVRANSITVIGRRTVHVFARGTDIHGAVIRFGEEMLAGAGGRASATWVMAARGGRVLVVPGESIDHLESLIALLKKESERAPDVHSLELQRHAIAILLQWLERWYEATRTEQRSPDDNEVQTYRRFVQVLEEDFARHHDAAHYAARLGLPAASLSRALSEVTGQATKELILDRVMVEAQRLVRFTDLAVQQIAQQVGFSDPLYFSRAFKRHAGESPSASRARIRGDRLGPALDAPAHRRRATPA